MTPQEIKQHLKLDITSKSREKHLVYLRTLYANNLVGKMSLALIGKSINRNHASVINTLKNYDVYQKDPLFKYINEAYTKKDIKMLKEYFKGIKIKKNEYRLSHEEKKFKKITLKSEKESKEKNVFEKIIRPNILEVSKKLRYIDTYLKNKYYNEWTDKDFKQYFKLINNETSTK